MHNLQDTEGNHRGGLTFWIMKLTPLRVLKKTPLELPPKHTVVVSDWTVWRVSSASLPLLSGINQAIQLSAFLARNCLIVFLYLPNNFSIHQPLISRNLYCMLFFHSRPPGLIGCNVLSLALASQFRHQISKMRERKWAIATLPVMSLSSAKHAVVVSYRY